MVTLNAGDFEAFPLPDDVANFVTDGYRSYFVEVEPGIKVHVLEVGSGFPLVLLHGNPTSGFLYRKVAAALPTDRVRVIMPTLVGLGFSSKVPASEHTLDNHIRWIGGVLKRAPAGGSGLSRGRTGADRSAWGPSRASPPVAEGGRGPEHALRRQGR